MHLDHPVLDLDIAGSVEPFLLSRGAHLVPHGRWSLHHHLIGTLTILAEWEQPAAVQAAGGLHSVYSTDAFATQLVREDERTTIRNLVGDDAERLVYGFCAVDRAQLWSAARERPHADAQDVPDRFTGATLRLPRADLRHLLVLHAANIVEQSARPDGSPGTWLSTVSTVLQLARTVDPVYTPPPVFEASQRVVAPDVERRLLVAYADTLRAMHETDAGETMPAVERVATVEHAPYVAEPFILFGLEAAARGDHVAAARYGGLASELALEWSCPWDKRLSARDWFAIAAFLAELRNAGPEQASFVADRLTRLMRVCAGLPERLHAQLQIFGMLGTVAPSTRVEPSNRAPDLVAAPASGLEYGDFDDLPPRFKAYVAAFRRPDRPRMTYPDLRSMPWWDPAEVDLAMELQRYAAEIIREFERADHDRFQPEGEAIKRVGAWDILPLYDRGRRCDDACRFFPETTRIIEEHRTFRSLGGLVYFSRLAGGSRVAPHRGPTNMRLRCHLGVEVPDRCGISVDGDVRSWAQGTCIVFDDSFLHEVWNESAADRVVLIVDVWHPDLSDEEVALLTGLQEHIASTARKLHSFWLKNGTQATPIDP